MDGEERGTEYMGRERVRLPRISTWESRKRKEEEKRKESVFLASSSSSSLV